MRSVNAGYEHGQQGGYAVRRPRVTDAVGGALLRSFAHAATVPDDMRRLLDTLDRRTQRRHA